MIKKFLLLLTLVLVSASLLQAQNVGVLAIPEAYPIGTMENPVHLDEYYMFLMDSTAPQTEITLPRVQAKFIGDTIPISVGGNPGGCTFLITQDAWTANPLLAALPTQEAQRLFNQWRQNPTVDELFAYLDDQVKSHKNIVSAGEASSCRLDALSIKNRYPFAPQFNGMTVFDTADWVSQNYATTCVYFFVCESNQTVLTIPGIHMLDLQQSRQKGMYENTRQGQVSFFGGPHRPQSIQYTGL